MSYREKVAEYKRVAETCLALKAYNAGVTRAYYAAFLHIKDCLERGRFDYADFMRRQRIGGRVFSHGTLRMATVSFLMERGKSGEAFKMLALDNMYRKRRTADYENCGVIEMDLEESLRDLDTILSVVA
jgi:uncharacterized protein (UPF0332 family)